MYFIISILNARSWNINNIKAPEWLHGRKILGPKAINEYNLLFGHSGASLIFIIFFTITIINNKILITIIYLFIFNFHIWVVHIFLLLFVNPTLDCLNSLLPRSRSSSVKISYCGRRNSFYLWISNAILLNENFESNSVRLSYNCFRSFHNVSTSGE